jgi:hypothetical protein
MDSCSRFLNVEDLLRDDDLIRVEKIYADILCSVTAYDPNCVESFVAIENRLYNHIITREKEGIQLKRVGWKAICLIFLTLGIWFLLLSVKTKCNINSTHKIHNDFSCAFKQMKSRVVQKESHPKLEAMQELEKSQLSDLDQELARLQSVPRIAASLKKISHKNLSKNHQVAFGRSVELREKLQGTHYVINHGQNLDLMLINMVARKLKREFEPHSYESFEPLRHDTALRHIKEDVHTVAWYRNEIKSSWWGTSDHSLRKELLCGDCVLESTGASESALDFFSGQRNIANSSCFVSQLFLTIVQDYIHDPKVAKKLCGDLKALMDRCPKGGNLYSVCVPKEKFNESCYFSEPFGVPLGNQEELRGKIDQMQAGEDPSYPPPQIRVLTHKIRPEDGYHVIMNSTLTREELLKIESEVSLCLQAALAGYRIQHLPEKIFG